MYFPHNGWEVISSPMARVQSDDDIQHPGRAGPARRPSSAIANASRVSDARFTHEVQPAASAGPALRVIMAAGKFHGVTRLRRQSLTQHEHPLVAW